LLRQGGEMCGALLMYYPHDHTRQFDWGAIVEEPPRIAEARDLCVHWDLARATCVDQKWVAQEGNATVDTLGHLDDSTMHVEHNMDNYM
jgi:hypothetical protein